MTGHGRDNSRQKHSVHTEQLNSMCLKYIILCPLCVCLKYEKKKNNVILTLIQEFSCNNKNKST